MASDAEVEAILDFIEVLNGAPLADWQRRMARQIMARLDAEQLPLATDILIGYPVSWRPLPAPHMPKAWLEASDGEG